MAIILNLIASVFILCFSSHGDAHEHCNGMGTNLPSEQMIGTDAQEHMIGVCNGRMGTNLPSEEEVVVLLKANNIGKYRIFQQEPTVLKAFANSGIELTVGIPNEELQTISSNQSEAKKWVNEYIEAYYPATNIKYIAVGSGVLGKTEFGQFLVGAMNNIQKALENANLVGKIKVSTTHAATDIIDQLAPLTPSNGYFSEKVKNNMSSVLQFLSKNGSPFMADVFPYFTYDDHRDLYGLDYALLEPSALAPIKDGDLTYTNLFYAMVDTIYSAIEKMGHYNISIMVTTTGWPSFGTGIKASIATVENARTYNNNLIKHVLSNEGTPKRPGKGIETLIYSLFNEDRKTGDETDKHWGQQNSCIACRLLSLF